PDQRGAHARRQPRPGARARDPARRAAGDRHGLPRGRRGRMDDRRRRRDPERHPRHRRPRLHLRVAEPDRGRHRLHHHHRHHGDPARPAGQDRREGPDPRAGQGMRPAPRPPDRPRGGSMSPINHRRTAGVALLAAVALTAAGCVDSGRSQTGDAAVDECPWEPDTSVEAEVTIGWQRIPNGDLVVKDLGLLEACMPNAQITWTEFDSGGQVGQAYASGDIDLALIGNSPSVLAMSPDNNLDVDVVWIHDVIGEAESLIAKDADVSSLEDLQGELIGVPFGSTAHYSLLQAILVAGLDPSTDFTITNLEPSAMPAAWSSDGIAAAWVWQPTQNELLESGGHLVLS